jgi:mannan endo-1,4-beta-mannosidase
MMNSPVTALSRRHLLAGAAAYALTTLPAMAASPSPFIRRRGTGFERNGAPWRYMGANAWYLAWLGADAPYGNRARLGRELDRLAALGVTNIRLLAGGEEGPLKNAVSPGFVNKAGQLNPARCWWGLTMPWPKSASGA